MGSGAWRWSLPYQDPDARGPYTVDDQVGEIISDNAANRHAGCAGAGRRAGFLKAILFNERNMPLRQALQMLPDPAAAVDLMNVALATL